MRLNGNASGLGSFFMRFAQCVTIMRASCGDEYTIDGRYVSAPRKAVESRGIITDIKRKLAQDTSGERIEGSLQFRIQGKVYTTSEDDIGAADVIKHDGSYWRVTSANAEGCDTVGSAVLLSDDQCVDLGLCR